jgi:hypothetical protein
MSVKVTFILLARLPHHPIGRFSEAITGLPQQKMMVSFPFLVMERRYRFEPWK